MSGGRCQRRKMMGRGAEGGCGTEEKPCPLSRVSSHSPPSTATPAKAEEAGPVVVDLYSQARKALSERSPFDAEETAGRVTTLPVALAVSLAKHSDGRRKHKKLHAEGGKKATRPPPVLVVTTVWDKTEEYFRPITLVDIDRLVPKIPSVQDSSLKIPALRGCTVSDRVEEVKLSSVLAASMNGAPEPVREDGTAVIAERVAPVTEAAPSPLPAPAEGEQVESVNEAAATVEDEKGQGEESMDIDDDGDAHSIEEDTTGSPEKREGEEGGPSLNWLLGFKHRVLLTSERPNKKRKLLGSDAGLERLLKLPHLEGGSSICDYCCTNGNISRWNQMLCCDSCKVSVHQKCYGVLDAPVGAWLCSWCKQLEVAGKRPSEDGEGPCLLCPKEGGALKPVGGDGSPNLDSSKFVHLFCSLWTPEVYVDNIEAMEPVMNVGGVHETRKKLVCHVCKVKHGACVRCSHGTCRASFHPICAREGKHRMEIWGKEGYDNVELRVFCSKHSTFQDSASAQHCGNLTLFGGNDSSVDSSVTIRSPVNKITELRFTRKSREKSICQHSTNMISEEVAKSETQLEEDTLALRSRPNCSDGQLNEDDTSDVENDHAVHSDPSSFPKFVPIFKKLIEKGKIKIHDVASEMGISSDSLEAALADAPNALSPQLGSEIVKWLHDSVHMVAPLRLPKSRGGYPVSQSGRASGNNASNAHSESLYGSNILSVESLDDDFDAVIVKSLPLRRRTKSTIRILKDKKMTSQSTDAFIQQHSNGKLIDETSDNPPFLTKDMKELGSTGSTLSDQDCSKEKEIPEMIVGDSGYPEPSLLEKLPEQKGDPVNVVSNGGSVKQHQEGHFGERVSPFRCGVVQADEVTTAVVTEKDADVGRLVNDRPDLKAAELRSGSYMHPLIEKMLRQMDCCVTKLEIVDDGCNGQREKVPLSIEAVRSASSSENQPLSAAPISVDNALNAAKLEEMAKIKGIKLDDLVKAIDLGILELSPQDEVEGEIIHLQNKLLDSAIAIKHHYEDLISKVVCCIPKELDTLKKHQWDLVLVNRFLREVKEARKRGRKERRLREAQVILAAVTAAAATSRVSSLRKDTNDETSCSHQEGQVKADAARGSVGSHYPIPPRANEKPSKLAVSKVSPGKNSEISVLSCDICKRAETLLNPIFICGSCKVAVHLDCYRKVKDPISSWHCEPCEEFRSHSRGSGSLSLDSGDKPVPPCCLCGATGGAFRKSADGQWVHAFCAEWILESFRRGQEHPVEGMDANLKAKDMLICCICLQKFGVCIKCGYGQCQTAFHPICARNAGLYMVARTTGGNMQHKAYCEKHSQEERDKADSQLHGAEELNNIRQLRVELEKLRLLCERIIKREKMKRELVLCSHSILASKRDYVAFSMLACTPFLRPGVSSESATTSINNTSYSETVERSDEITVDSTVSGKRRGIFSSNINNADRRTGDSSVLHLPLTRKASDRTSFAGKQLPQRLSSIPFDSTADDEKKCKPRKHTETFQKELVMTSDQASLQNQRLPKGFAYVPMDRLSKSQESHEPHSPDG